MNAMSQPKKFLANNIRGFTLLEVLIALAILVLVLGSILTVQSSSIRAATNAKEMNTVTLLARNLMTETETKLEGRGFTEVAKMTEGQFDNPYQDYKWKVEIKEIKFPNISFTPQSAGDSGGTSGGGGDGSQSYLIDRIVKIITTYLSKAIREVQITVSWQRGDNQLSYSVSTFWVNLNEELSLNG